ncbi:MAG: hypothetical protein PWR10_986 [Halanaerobiales bacterium]|nr:hypothetical protein [Halanaerobiales bacterium]
MKKIYWVTLLVIILVAGLISFQTRIWPLKRSNVEDIEIGTNVGQKAPDFTLKTLKGESVSLSNLKGKKVFLNFWASWCPPCRSEMPAIQKLYSNHDDIAVLGINLREEKGTVAEFMMLNGYTFPVVLDLNAEVATKYLVRGIPTTYILNKEGVIMAKHTGPLTYEQMLEMMEIE